MSDAKSFAEFEDHTAELLPARTVLSMMGANNQINNPAGGDHPMYDTWMDALTLLGVPHYQAPQSPVNPGDH